MHIDNFIEGIFDQFFVFPPIQCLYNEFQTALFIGNLGQYVYQDIYNPGRWVILQLFQQGQVVLRMVGVFVYEIVYNACHTTLLKIKGYNSTDFFNPILTFRFA